MRTIAGSKVFFDKQKYRLTKIAIYMLNMEEFTPLAKRESKIAESNSILFQISFLNDARFFTSFSLFHIL